MEKRKMASRFSFRSLCVLTSSCLFAFISNGSFKACGVLFDDSLVIYNTSNLFAGWAFSFQLSVAFMVGGLSGVFAKDFSYRKTGMFGGFLFGFGFACLGIFGQQIFQLFLFTGITAVGGGLLYYVCYMSLIDHFKDNFGFFFAIREVFSFVGITVMPPLLELLRSSYGFHGGYLLLGAITWNMILCGVLLQPVVPSPAELRKNDLPDEHREEVNQGKALDGTNADDTKSAPALSISSLTRHPQFSLYIFVHSLFYYEFAVWAVFLVPFAKSLGFNADVAVFLSTAGGIGGLFGKIASIVVFFLNKMNVLTSSMPPAVLCTVSLIGYMYTTNYTALLLFSFLYGFALAYVEAALSGVLPNYVCRYHLRQGVTIAYLIQGAIVQIAGIITGAILDLTSSFTVVFESLIFWNIVVCVLTVIWAVADTPVSECDS